MSNVLRRTFNDIINGFSIIRDSNITYYAKHLSHKEHINLEEIEESFIQKAKSQGLPTEEEQTEYLKKNGLWSNKKDSEIIHQKIFIDGLKSNKKSVILPSILKSIDGQIKEAEEKINELEKEKRELMGLTCESYASKLVNEYYIWKSLYKDEQLTIPFYSEEEFYNITDDELSNLIAKYNLTLDICSDSNIKKLSIQDFFQSYFFLCSDISSFYGKPIVNLTYFQIKLANNAKYYKSIFENHDMKTVPENIKNDPDKLADYVNAKENGKKILDNNANSDAVGLVGATKEDLEALGHKQGKQDPREDLKELFKAFER